MIFTDPPAIAVTSPVEASTDATEVLLLVHVPLVGVVDKVVVEPLQRLVGPDIIAGDALTVTVCEIVQPLAVMVYDMSADPGPVPVTTPVVLTTVATAVLLLLHVPPVVVFVSVVVAPSHTENEPPIAAGSGFTTKEVVLKHPALM